MIRQEFIWNEINKYRNRGIAISKMHEQNQFTVDLFETNDAIIELLTTIAGPEPIEETEDGDFGRDQSD